MGIIEKEGELVWIRTDDRQVISKERVKELEDIRKIEIIKIKKELNSLKLELSELASSQQGDVERQIQRMDELEKIIPEKEIILEKHTNIPPAIKIKSKGLIFYSDGDYFEYFYLKHVKHSTGEGISSVLIFDDGTAPSREETRLALEFAIRNSKIMVGIKEQNVDTPQNIIRGKTLGIREWSFSQNEFITPFSRGVFCLRDMKKVNKLTEFAKEIKDQKISEQFIQKAQKIINQGDCAISYISFIDKYFVAVKKRIFG
jgi:hypothetical protein